MITFPIPDLEIQVDDIHSEIDDLQCVLHCLTESADSTEALSHIRKAIQTAETIRKMLVFLSED